MISFQQAQELKDAGFPQGPGIDISGIDGPFFGSFYYIVKNGAGEVAPNFLDQNTYARYAVSASDPRNEQNPQPELLRIPQFEEILSEMDPVDFQYLQGEWGMSDDQNVFYSVHGRLVSASSGNYETKGNLIESGTGPAEALAKLWIETKKHGARI